MSIATAAAPNAFRSVQRASKQWRVLSSLTRRVSQFTPAESVDGDVPQERGPANKYSVNAATYNPFPIPATKPDETAHAPSRSREDVSRKPNPAKKHPVKDGIDTSSQKPTTGSTQAASASSHKPLLNFTYQPRPRPINCVTLPITQIFASDIAHPLHIRTTRRLAAFDPSKLHWRINIPPAVSKRSAIRNWAKKRLKVAFQKELRTQGFTKDGALRDGTGQGIGGALLMTALGDPQRALRFTIEEAEDVVRFVLGKVVQRWQLEHKDAGVSHRRRPPGRSHFNSSSSAR